MAVLSTIGAPVVRIEGTGKVTGRVSFTADVRLPGTLWGAVVRSPHPHARVIRVDTSRAASLPGVHAVITGQDTERRRVGRFVGDIPILAFDRVLYVGDPVAAVAGDDPDIVQEALKLIGVDYEPLPAVFDPRQAMQSDAPILHPDYRTYRGAKAELPDLPNLCGYAVKGKGDVEQGLREADLVLEHTYYTPMHHQGYIEPHTCLVSVEAEGMVRVWASNKAPFGLRDVLARDLGLPATQIVVEPTYIGGDFGGKGGLGLIPVAYFLSKASGRPVRMVMSATEELTAANPRHAAWTTVKTGLKRDGAIVARHVKVILASGGYAGYKPFAATDPDLPLAAIRHAPGPYRMPHTRMECYIVYTNTVPCGYMRSPGGHQVGFAGEVDMDRLAEAVGMDPLEFRLKNAVLEGDIGPLGEPWTSQRLKECLETVREASGWGQPKARNVGRGVAAAESGAGGGGSAAEVLVDRHGVVTLRTGTSEQGCGSHTILTQIAAHELQVPLERVKLVVTGTQNGVWDSGAAASRVTYVAGRATVQAAAEVREKLASFAAEFLGCPESQVELVGGGFRDRDQPQVSISFEEVAAQASRDGQPVAGSGRFENWERPGATSFVAQVAEVEVDPETGRVYLRRLVAASDVGTVINPIGVIGQLEGGEITGLGAGTMEELRVTEDGRIETVGLNDYKLPTIMDIPEITNLLITSGEGPGPYGAKAVSEFSHLPVPPAVANAVYNAVGVRLEELPITAERVHRAIRAKQGG